MVRKIQGQGGEVEEKITLRRYENSYEDIASISPRAGRKGSEESVTTSESPPSAVVNTTSSPANTGSNKGSKGRSGSGPPSAQTLVFGTPADDLFAREGGNVPYFFNRMIQYLEERGIFIYIYFLFPFPLSSSE
jgi:hypothetical protein